MFKFLKQSSDFSHVFLVSMLLIFCGMSYFGKLNPNPAGLLSSVLVSLSCYLVAVSIGSIGRAPYVVSMLIIWGFLVLLTVGNWWHFQYFQSYFNYESLSLGRESVDGLKAFSTFDKKSASWLMVVLSGALLVIELLTYRKSRFKSASSLKLFVLALVMTLTGGYVMAYSIDKYQQMNVFRLSPNYLSPVHAFFVSPEPPKNLINTLKDKNIFQQMNAVNNQHLMNMESKGYNVIVITLESIRASMIGFYSGEEGGTPNIDRFARQNVSVRNFYANANFTVKSETAIWCGIFDHNSKPPIAKSAGDIERLDCLPEILRENGYRTVYFHGNKSDFYDRDRFLPLVGFDKLQFYGKERIHKEGLETIGWGVSDEQIYDLMLEDLEKISSSAPFFANVMTLSSHYPFNWRWGIEIPDLLVNSEENKVYKNYRIAAYYEDYAFGKFWQTFKQSNLASNTIVVLTADHGIWSFPDSMSGDSLFKKNEYFFRMPLFMYHPDIESPVVIDQVASQVDIPPTLLSMLGLDVNDAEFVGKDIFQEVEAPWAVMMKSGEVTVRVNDLLCTSGVNECSGIHQECIASMYADLYIPGKIQAQNCVRIKGDLLTRGETVKADVEEQWVGRAFNLINYQNQMVFEEPARVSIIEESTHESNLVKAH